MEIQYIKGVGAALAKKLQKLGLVDTKDVLAFFPTGWEDRRKIPPIAKLEIGKDQFTVGKIVQIRESTRGKYHLTKVLLDDGHNKIMALWFNQAYLMKLFKVGTRLFVSGKIERDPVSGTKIIKVSQHEWLEKDNTGRIIPIYPLTNGVYQKQLRHIVDLCLRQELKLLQEPFPPTILEAYTLLPLAKAIWYFHYPADENTYRQAKRRLVMEDFFYLQLVLAITRERNRSEDKGIAFTFKNTLSAKYFDSLPYKLTGAQSRVIAEVLEDMKCERPMNRLVQGDVGAGKTEIAMAAILMALENNYQAAIMAPTEILATQHYQKMLHYLMPLGIQVELLVGSLKAGTKARKQQLVSSGHADLVVGTHALIQEKVGYDHLGLVIIDEQHRFGVLQRRALTKKSGEVVDLLVLTATPIPRSLTLTLYGDLDKSILDELPPGRIPIKTVWIKKLDAFWMKAVRDEVAKGNQIYWVFPLVEESEKIDLRAATEGSQQIALMFPDVRVGLLHGKMKQREKDAVMAEFRARNLDILVATTVIEVGVDVPDATMMIIEHAERFGLSQLHQLRGRIGRRDKVSTCVLISTTRTDNSMRRLGAMVETTDGFKLAEVDLELRGPGDYFGSKQSGIPTMAVANLLKDERILLEAKKLAERIAADRKNPLYAGVFRRLHEQPHLYVGQEGMN